MELNKAVEVFRGFTKKSHAFDHALGVMYYDLDTAAPKNAAQGFAETMEIMSEITYNLTVDPERMEAVEVLMAHKDELPELLRREAEEEHKSIEFMKNIPIEEYTAFTALLAEANSKWREAKNTNNYSLFEPILAKIVDYNRKFAEYQHTDKCAYDYWLNEFEDGASIKMLDEFFGKLKKELVPLVKRITEKGDIIDASFMNKSYPIPEQRKFMAYLMNVMGINPDDCVLGEVEHPFTTNFNKHDVRITTHYYENMAISSMYSVIHEGGHALYELNTGDDLIGSPLATGSSLGIHESQSRFYENIIGRSEAFIEYVFPEMKKLFPEQLEGVTAHDFYLAVNKSEPSLIRTEADEVTYCLHIMVRYELEKRLMDGSLTTKELPAEWNRLYKEYLGVDVPSDTEGVLQDSHWSGGSIGYFPSYALGSAYGAQIYHHMKKELDIDKLVSEGRIPEITAWLTDKIYKYGKVKKPYELIMNACGEKFNADYYVNYLKEKYEKIYNL